MSKQKHTPGPWEAKTDMGDTRIVPVDGYGNTRSDGPICKVFYNHTANARLIAAAPELLEACKVGVIMLRELNEGHANRTIETMNEIIAKVEGGLP